MTCRELFRLSHREFTAYQTRSRATVIVIGTMFGVLLAVLMVVQGLENVVLKYANDAMSGDLVNVDQCTEENPVASGCVRKFFRDKNRDFVHPATIVLMAIAALILALTLAHLLSSNVKIFVLYRSLGASKLQLLLIYLMYLWEICMRAAIFAIVLALIIAGIVTAVGWNYLSGLLAATYPEAHEFWPVLLGVNEWCLGTLVYMLLTVPIAFLLCLDQFSDKKLTQRLKGD